MMKTYLLPALLALGLAASPTAFAQNVAKHSVIVDNPAITAALKTTVGTPSISEAVARQIGPMMYADNILTPHESDLFIALLGNGSGKVSIVSGKDHFDVPPLSPGAKFFLGLSNPPDLDTLWLTGPAQMKKLVDVTLLNPFVEGQVKRFIGQQFYLSWQASNFADGYKPLRSTVNMALLQWQLAGPVTQAQAKKLAYGAIIDVDHAMKDAIPNDIYDGLKP